MTLHALWGHEAARKSLARATRAGSLPSGLFVHGPRGVGKQRLALWLAQLLLCEESADQPCDACKSCRLALNLEHPDVHWFFPLARPRGASSPAKLADALERARYEELASLRAQPLQPSHHGEARAIYLAAAQTLRRSAIRRPSMSSTQVFILGDAESLVPQESSPEAANALLKLLEEPPDSTRFILTSSEPGKVLSTIRSRTLPLHLPGLASAEVEQFLIEVAEAEPSDAQKAARLAGGSVGRALGFLPEAGEPGPLEQLRQRSFHLFRAGLSERPGEAFSQGLSFKVAGARALLPLLVSLQGWLRDLAAVASGAPERILNYDARDYLERVVSERHLDPAAVSATLALVEDAMEQASGNVNPQLVVTGVILGLRSTLAEPSMAEA